jgi:hypothetical protein
MVSWAIGAGIIGHFQALEPDCGRDRDRGGEDIIFPATS